MLRITAHKVAQLFPERYRGEHAELRDEYARDEYEQSQYDKSNVYFIRETYIDPSTGQETEHISDDGYASAEEAASIAQSDLQNSIQEGATSVDIVHKTDGWIQSVWSRDAESTPMAQPMPMPFPR
jgi:hypothetical protein